MAITHTTKRLSHALKSNNEYTLFNTYTTKRCFPIVHKPKKLKPLLSTKTIHYCILFSADNTPLLAIEVFTYLTFYKSKIEKLVYVSKADTTGLNGLIDVHVGLFVTEYLKIVCEMSVGQLVENVYLNTEKDEDKPGKSNDGIKDCTFMSETQYGLYILQQRSAGNVNFHMPKESNKINAIDFLKSLGMDSDILSSNKIFTKLVLFTRSEGQYLFPESMKNKGKHILDGSKLLKWWLKNVETVVNNINCSTVKKYLNVLNLDSAEIQRYFPSSNWNVGNVYEYSDDVKDPAIYHIPLLPDDPKGRFLEHLVVEGRAKKVGLKRYWQELAIRQEFRFGAIVGLIGILADIITNENTKNSDYLSNSNLKQLNEIIASKDYSDKSDWSLLFEEINELSPLTAYKIVGSNEQTGVHKRETISPVVINTLMCVRKKRRLS